MSIEEEDDRPHRDFTELLPIGLAMILTAAAIGLIFFKFTVGSPQPVPADSQMHLEPGEVMIGVGAGSSIHPAPASPPAAPAKPAPANPGHP